MLHFVDGIQLGSSTEILVAWWGNHPHPLCRQDPDINTIVCQPDEEDTMVATQTTGWMHYILKKHTCSVADLFSVSGKMSDFSLLVLALPQGPNPQYR